MKKGHYELNELLRVRADLVVRAKLKRAQTDIAEVWAENARLAASYQDDADAVCKALGAEWTDNNEYPTVALSAIAQLQDELARAVSDPGHTYDEWWYVSAKKFKKERDEARAELNRMRLDMQDQSDEVQELWLNPREAEGLKRQLAKAEAQAASVKQAVEWLWGFWDGNTLVARSSGYEENIGAAWNKLLKTSGAFSKSRKQLTEQRAKSTERELGVEMTDAEMGEALRAEVRKRVTAEADAHTLSKALDECTQTVHTERQLRREAEQRAEALAALVTPRLAEMLERLTWIAEVEKYPVAARHGRDFAVKIREVLDDSQA